MKKLFVNPVMLVSLIATILFISSCEESAEIVEADLIGTWDIEQATVDIKVGPVSLFDFLVRTLQYGDEAAKEVVDQVSSEYLQFGSGSITFNADYSYLMSRSEIEESGTWSLEGDKLYMNLADEVDNEEPLTVRSMNNTAAVVAWEEEQKIDLGEVSSPFNATIIIELDLIKQ